MRFKGLLILPLLVASLQAASVNDLTFDYGVYGYSVAYCDSSASGSLDIPSVYNGSPVTSIGSFAFRDCTSLEIFNIPNSVTSIGVGAFTGCSSLTSITIPDGVTSIATATFLNCTSLVSVIIPEGVTSIESWAFAGCWGLTSITIPDTVTSIGSAFAGCTNLSSITIPDGVTSIGGDAFKYCYSLSSITIPESVTSIGDNAFAECTNLASITFEGDAPALSGSQTFYRTAESAVIYYYANSNGFTSPTWQGIQTEAISRPAQIIAGIEKSEVGVNLWFNSASGQNYQIESSNDLENWTMLEDDIISEGDTVIRYYDTVGIQKRFYRVKRND